MYPLRERESPPPALMIKAGMRALCARFCWVEVRNHGKWIESRDASVRHSGEEDRRRRQAWPCFSLVVNVEPTFFVTFCQFHRKLVRHRATRRTRNQAVFFLFFYFYFLSHVDERACASSGQAQSPLIDVSTNVSSSCTRTFPFASLAGLVQRLTACFKLFFFHLRRAVKIFQRISRNVCERCLSKCVAPFLTVPLLILFFFFCWALSISPSIVRVWFDLLLLGQHRSSLGCCKDVWTQIMQAKSFQRPFTAGFSCSNWTVWQFWSVRRKLVSLRDTGQTINQAICFVTRRTDSTCWLERHVPVRDIHRARPRIDM